MPQCFNVNQALKKELMLDLTQDISNQHILAFQEIVKTDVFQNKNNFQNNKFECVVNLAAQAGVRRRAAQTAAGRAARGGRYRWRSGTCEKSGLYRVIYAGQPPA